MLYTYTHFNCNHGANKKTFEMSMDKTNLKYNALCVRNQSERFAIYVNYSEIEHETELKLMIMRICI